MAGLPYWTNSTAAVNYYEPIYQNQFEVILTPPAVIGGPNVALLVEHVTKISGLPEISSAGTLVEQEYKFAKRSYAGAVPDTTVADIEISFTVNLNEENDAYVYNILRAWNDVVYNPQSGAQGLKRDYADAIISVNIFNRVGDIYRQFDFTPVFLGPDKLTEMKLDYASEEIFRLQATFTADTYTETRIGAL
jgi:hypothetical protein